MDFAFYWAHTDAVSKILFFILVLLSIASWTVGIVKILHAKRTTNDIDRLLKDTLSTQEDALSNLSFAQKKMALEQLLLQQIARIRFSLEQGLMVLGTTASIAPFVGLFGTVWGVFHALHGVAQSGQAGLAQVAGPVGEALIMTGLGLGVAIPAVLFYNVIGRLNRRALHQATDTSHAILANAAL